MQTLKSLRISSLVLTQYTNVTDGQTLQDGIGRAVRSVARQQLYSLNCSVVKVKQASRYSILDLK